MALVHYLEKHICFSLFVLLACFSLVFAWHTGSIALSGDDWRAVSLSYEKDFSGSLQALADNMRSSFPLRPFEGLVHVVSFKLLGLDTSAHHALQLLSYTAACCLFGRFVSLVFASAPVTFFGVLFSFFSPASFSLTFRPAFFNGILASLWFFAAAICFLKASRDEARRNLHYMAFTACFLLSTLCYDSHFIMVFILIAVWELTTQGRAGRTQAYAVLVFSFLIAVLLKYGLFHGGPIKVRSTSIPAMCAMLLEYARVLCLMFVESIQDAAGHEVPVLCAATALLVPLLFFLRNRQMGMSPIAPFLLGALMFVFGSLPYLAGGYGAAVVYTGGNRIYSSSCFGAALMLSSCALASRKLFRVLLFPAMLLVLSAAILFALSFGRYSREAAQEQHKLFMSLLEQAPQIEDHTRIIFLDCQQYVSNKATVMDGVSGTFILPRIIYSNPTLTGTYIYSLDLYYAMNQPGEIQPALISPEGIQARGAVFISGGEMHYLQKARRCLLSV